MPPQSDGRSLAAEATAAASMKENAGVPYNSSTRSSFELKESSTRTREHQVLLALHEGATPLRDTARLTQGGVTLLSGPEGGLSRAEEAAAMDCGFAPVSLGARVLRAETAALVGLALLV